MLLLLFTLVGCTSRAQISYSTWSEQVAFAERSAKEIDPDAILFSVDANLDRSDRVEGPISYTFRFMRPSGLAIELQVLDTIPPRIVNSVPENGSGNANTRVQANRELFEDAIQIVTVGPREVLNITKQQGLRFSRDNNVLLNPRMTLHMGEEIQKLFGTPAIWIVNYISSGEELYICIDPSSGAIVREASSLLELFR